MPLDLKRWAKGDGVTASRLNRMQDGIELALADLPSAHRVQKMRPWLQFQVECSTDTAVRVHAGQCMRFTAEDIASLNMTVDGGGTSDDPDTYLTIAGIAATGYILAALDDAMNPTTLTVSWSATWPTTVDETQIVLAKITVAGGVITQIDTVHTGIWYSFYWQVDSASLDYNSNDEGQVYGFETAAGGTPAADDLIFLKDISESLGMWATPHILVETAATDGADLAGAAWTDPPWEAAEAISHHDLAGLNDESDDDDHLWALCNVTSGYDATYARNYIQSLGRLDGVTIKPILDADNMRLVQDALATVKLDWSSTGYTDIPADIVFRVLDDTETTDGTDGAFLCSGAGAFVKKVSASEFWIGDGLTCRFGPDSFACTFSNLFGVQTTNTITLTAGSDLVLAWSGDIKLQGNAFTLTTANIDIGGVATSCEILLRVL